jgi:hypothetical protein
MTIVEKARQLQFLTIVALIGVCILLMVCIISEEWLSAVTSAFTIVALFFVYRTNIKIERTAKMMDGL